MGLSMNLFIAVVFFCSGGECYFWKAPTNYYNKEECVRAVDNFSKLLEDKEIPSFGNCLLVNTRNDI
jgi:hypothetical protein